jgi:aspartate carbamoyltransferase catalytic subunit
MGVLASRPNPRTLHRMRALHDGAQLSKWFDHLVSLITSNYRPEQPLNIVGIRTRGAVLADRLVWKLRGIGFTKIDHGVVDITLHRDDLATRGTRAVVGTSKLDLQLDGVPLLLVDDVLFTGRSMRAALDAVTEFGRPSATQIAVLIDRGGREFPIQADYVGHTLVDVPRDHRVRVRFNELDDADEVIVSPGVESELKPSSTAWNRKHLLTLEELSAQEIVHILDTAKGFADVSTRSVKKVPALRGKVIVNAFFEDSTRTRTSFALAASRLSADVVDFSEKGSSVSKGETLIDTARNIEAMGIDAIVIRHQAAGSALQLARTVKCSVINAGDGAHEHPTQGLLDLYTIRERFGKVEGLKVAIVGDIANSRVARSDLWGLTKLGATVYLVGPPTLLPKSFEKLGAKVVHDFDSIIGEVDVINMLRVQNERMKSAQFPTVREFTRLFGLTWDRFHRCRKDVFVMHPGPMNRGVEIHNEIADGPNSGILKQVENGLAVRMACLYLTTQVGG